MLIPASLWLCSLFSMFTARQKIKKEKGEPTELENQVSEKHIIQSEFPRGGAYNV